MNVRAKMKCTEVTKTELGAEIVKLTAVYGGDKNSEDNTFSKATPCAEMSMTVSNKAAHGAFVPGKTYYLDFTPADIETTES